MVSKVYKAVDKSDNELTLFLVNERGVARTPWRYNNDMQLSLAKQLEHDYVYEPARRFNDAIDPVLIAEW